MNLLDWDREMKWGQIRSLGPLIWKKHQEGFAMTPPKAPVSVLVKALNGMSTLHVCLGGRRFGYVASSRVYSMSCPSLGTHAPLHPESGTALHPTKLHLPVNWHHGRLPSLLPLLLLLLLLGLRLLH